VISGIESNDPGISFSTHHVNAWEEGDEIVIDYASNMWSNMPVKYLDLLIHYRYLELGSRL